MFHDNGDFAATAGPNMDATQSMVMPLNLAARMGTVLANSLKSDDVVEAIWQPAFV